MSKYHEFRDMFGGPFRPLPPKEAKPCSKELLNSWLGWNNGTVLKLAQAIYHDLAFDRLPMLADALEDASCQDEDILRHCREQAKHCRHCWVIDLLLGKE
jgi:hypothetical protein